ncbi:MAG: hypothetical protein VCC01_02065, partial [Candidatus Hydrogenedentota bacterium]
HQKILAKDVESDSTCVKCNEKPALSHSIFCLTCQLAMYKSLCDEASLSAQNPINNNRKIRFQHPVG